MYGKELQVKVWWMAWELLVVYEAYYMKDRSRRLKTWRISGCVDVCLMDDCLALKHQVHEHHCTGSIRGAYRSMVYLSTTAPKLDVSTFQAHYQNASVSQFFLIKHVSQFSLLRHTLPTTFHPALFSHLQHLNNPHQRRSSPPSRRSTGATTARLTPSTSPSNRPTAPRR